MEPYSIYEDFSNYVEENKDLIHFLEENHSLLNDFVAPIIRALTYIKSLKDQEDEAFNQDDANIFQYGFEYLFENLEQLKLYLKALDDDYFNLEQNSYYIKMVFQLEELKVEINKKEHLSEEEREADINTIDQALSYFEGLITPQEKPTKESEMNNHLQTFMSMYQKYEDVILLHDAFEQYCGTYGI